MFNYWYNKNEKIYPKLTNEEIKFLEKQDAHTLAKWWCELNNWKWPKAIPNPETMDERMAFWRNGENYNSGKRTRAMQIMTWIDNQIGHRACLQEWNKDRMTPKQFDEFWEESEKTRQ